VKVACVGEAARGTPSPAGRVVQFRAAKIDVPGNFSSCHQHLAVGQQGRRVITACGVEGAGGVSPAPAGRVVQFRAAKPAAAAIISPCHQHLAVGQQRRRVRTACGVEGASGSPHPAGRVVQFRAVKIAAVISPCHQHLAVGQQRRRVITACGVEGAGGAKCERGIGGREALGQRLSCNPQVPIAGSDRVDGRVQSPRRRSGLEIRRGE
jgi:hypothetical protein